MPRAWRYLQHGVRAIPTPLFDFTCVTSRGYAMSGSQLREKVVITGVGCSRFGDLLSTPELKGKSLQELSASAVKEALDDAGISGQDVDAVFVGNAMEIGRAAWRASA